VPPTSTTTVPSTTPTTLKVYTDSSNRFKVMYLDYFTPYTGSDLKNNKYFVDIHADACGTDYPPICFVLKNDLYKNTNLASAALSIRTITSATTAQQCTTFSKEEMDGGRFTDSVTINGVVFVTAQNGGAAAGNYYESHLAHTWYGGKCYAITQTVHSTAAANYDPPRQEFDKADVWFKLDTLRNGFSFIQ